MHPTVELLLQRRTEVDRASWHALWDALHERRLDRADALAMLGSLAGALPGPASLSALLESFADRRPTSPQRRPGTVNVVGTGGGPGTFNISTAAAFTAAATGVPVVKSGSRAYTGVLGSIDLLERLGIRPAASYDQLSVSLDRFGLAFAGGFVYPAELTRLARLILPTGLRPFGRFLNTLGPFLADLPVTAQVTGVSDRTLLPLLRDLAATVRDRRIWLFGNDAGADELLPFAVNEIHPNSGTAPPFPAPVAGGLGDLRPGADPAGAAARFLEVVSGAAGDTAIRTVAWNAAALALAGGHATDWAPAVTEAEKALREGAVLALVLRMRTDG
ncbi:hypothetical protein [Actinoplanes derwentensis]|uniref:Anthranilate phosphoribosyltransferase n=1 Tax=Actinoplanes derwentensis TaxID=113562 RepID=A0A1H1R9Y2_9ACTN|nr:hypothetical protein [Actinoplanes derwentensis]GID88055.1 anthranilate phosphoribosyltransferase [Actinoplanes derwentensis]SDS32587.1 anthranilate phosphoribosyltransferase [Actinoplanes derwentensis]